MTGFASNHSTMSFSCSGLRSVKIFVLEDSFFLAPEVTEDTEATDASSLLETASIRTWRRRWHRALGH